MTKAQLHYAITMHRLNNGYCDGTAQGTVDTYNGVRRRFKTKRSAQLFYDTVIANGGCACGKPNGRCSGFVCS